MARNCVDHTGFEPVFPHSVKNRRPKTPKCCPLDEWPGVSSKWSQ